MFATNRRVTIGSHALVAHEVVFADHAAPVPPGARRPAPDAGHDADIVVGDNVWLGIGSVVLGGARIGDDVIIGARTVVDFDVPDGAIVAGDPARVIRREARSCGGV